MLDLKLVSKDEKSVTYDYYPENEKVSGRITISIEECEILYAKKSEYDQDTSNYLGHAIYRIKKYIKNNEFPETDLVAWG
ncbi:hypothetical protein MT416_06325 [Mammaliicoccus sciuri]|uniref:hypothetical protein n=1 Tax=Mammaliicoccus sciuri TaxID=1296 RepID=UPI001330DA06|nr:hypothetical protein [Mammaliicoccus sciuri]MCJ1748920.1 hypothetical protein [Mammaliicoccus sciuri]